MKLITLIFCMVICMPQLRAQDIVGLWEVKNVTVGQDTMTPIARWTRINKDGTYQSGNGWVQNSVGTWEFDKGATRFLPTPKNGLKDPYGPFEVRMYEDDMRWQREEDGVNVVVSLSRIEDLPMAPADHILGLWDLVEAVENGESILDSYDPNEKRYMFIRWDRIYVERTPEGKRSTGYWHMDGHRPNLTLMSHDKSREAETWSIEVSDRKLKMEGISDTNKDFMLVFVRIDTFPN